MLVGRGAEISVSSALKPIHDGANLDKLGTTPPLESDMAQVHDRQSAPWLSAVPLQGLVTPVHCAVARRQALNDVASLRSAQWRP